MKWVFPGELYASTLTMTPRTDQAILLADGGDFAIQWPSQAVVSFNLADRRPWKDVVLEFRITLPRAARESIITLVVFSFF